MLIQFIFRILVSCVRVHSSICLRGFLFSPLTLFWHQRFHKYKKKKQHTGTKKKKESSLQEKKKTVIFSHVIIEQTEKHATINEKRWKLFFSFPHHLSLSWYFVYFSTHLLLQPTDSLRFSSFFFLFDIQLASAAILAARSFYKLNVGYFFSHFSCRFFFFFS